MGPIARCVKDLATALTVMTSVRVDGADNATLRRPPEATQKDYTSGLTGGTLSGLRFGMIESFFNHTTSDETDSVVTAMQSARDWLRRANVTIVSINEPMYNSATILKTLDTQRYEYLSLIHI